MAIKCDPSQCFTSFQDPKRNICSSAPNNPRHVNDVLARYLFVFSGSTERWVSSSSLLFGVGVIAGVVVTGKSVAYVRGREPVEQGTGKVD